MMKHSRASLDAHEWWFHAEMHVPQERGTGTSAGAADREIVYAQGRLTDAHRHALPFLAAGPDAFVELEIVAHHAHACEHIWPVTNERGALQRRAELAVLDRVRLACGEHELAGG